MKNLFIPGTSEIIMSNDRSIKIVSKQIEPEDKNLSIVKLPSVLAFSIFSYLSAADLLNIKRVAKNFKFMSETYIKQTEDQICYATGAYGKSQVLIGTKTQVGSIVTTDLYKVITSKALIRAFKYDSDEDSYLYSLWPITSMMLFRSEDEAFNYLLRDVCEGRFPMLYKEKVRDMHTRDADFIYTMHATPIYKVQCIHANIKINAVPRYDGSKVISVKQFKENKELSNVDTNTSNFIPLSATVKVKFYQRSEIETIAKDISLKKIEDNDSKNISDFESQKNPSKRLCTIL